MGGRWGAAAWDMPRRAADLPYPRFAPGVDAVYELDEAFELAEVRPMIAKPFSPGNAFPAEDVARERIEFTTSIRSGAVATTAAAEAVGMGGPALLPVGRVVR